MKPDVNPDHNPFAALLAKLSGVTKPPQRARQGWQQFMHECNEDVIAPAIATAWAAKLAAGLEENDRNDMSYRADIARDLFNNLSATEKVHYHANAKRDKEGAVVAYKDAVQRALSTDNRSPAQRQL